MAGEEGVLTISGTGRMYDMAAGAAPWYAKTNSINSLVIDEGVTSIGDYAFFGCSNLARVSFPNSLSSIGSYAFYHCNRLVEVTIPEGLTLRKDRAFYDCKMLSAIDVSEKNPSYSFLEGVLFNRNMSEIVLFPAGKTNATYTIPDGVTSIRSYAFFECSNLTQIIIPDGMKSIGEGAFDNCFNLANINIPDSVRFIGSAAFFSCSFLTTVNIPDGVLSIGDKTFWGCKSLSQVTIPDSVESIGDSSFSQCSGLTTVIIGNNVSSIGPKAFADCNSLTSVTIPNTLKTIGESAFSKCSMTELVIPDSVTSIGNYAFEYCSSLASVTIGGNISSMGMYVFRNCEKLKTVLYKGSIDFSSTHVFFDCSLLNAVCVLSTYNPSTFCGVNTTIRPESKCFDSYCENNEWELQKKDSAVEWEKRSNGCVQFQCDDDSGLVSWSKCYSSDNMAIVCKDNKCIVDEEKCEGKWEVEVLFVDGVKPTEFDASEVSTTISALTGIKQDDFVLGIQVDDDGYLRLVLFVDSEEKAQLIVDAVRGIKQGDNCPYGVLCRVKSARARFIGPTNDLSDCHRTTECSAVMILVVLMLLL